MPDKNKPKTENYYKDTKPDIIQVFDSCKIPDEFGGEETTLIIGGKYEGCGNDTYHRWYPDRIEKKEIGEYKHFETEKDWEAGKLFNDWLLTHGMVVNPDTFCFHVLIYVHW